MSIGGVRTCLICEEVFADGVIHTCPRSEERKQAGGKTVNEDDGINPPPSLRGTSIPASPVVLSGRGEPLTSEELRAIRERCAIAVEGPWYLPQQRERLAVVTNAALLALAQLLKQDIPRLLDGIEHPSSGTLSEQEVERLAWLLRDVAERLPLTDAARERYGECLEFVDRLEAILAAYGREK